MLSVVKLNVVILSAMAPSRASVTKMFHYIDPVAEFHKTFKYITYGRRKVS
jgi:hypothetical protein